MRPFLAVFLTLICLETPAYAVKAIPMSLSEFRTQCHLRLAEFRTFERLLTDVQIREVNEPERAGRNVLAVEISETSHLFLKYLFNHPELGPFTLGTFLGWTEEAVEGGLDEPIAKKVMYWPQFANHVLMTGGTDLTAQGQLGKKVLVAFSAKHRLGRDLKKLRELEKLRDNVYAIPQIAFREMHEKLEELFRKTFGVGYNELIALTQEQKKNLPIAQLLGTPKAKKPLSTIGVTTLGEASIRPRKVLVSQRYVSEEDVDRFELALRILGLHSQTEDAIGNWMLEPTTSVLEVGFSKSTRARLIRAGYKTLADVEKMSDSECQLLLMVAPDAFDEVAVTMRDAKLRWAGLFDPSSMTQEEIRRTPITFLRVGPLRNVEWELIEAGYETVGDFVGASMNDLKQLPGLQRGGRLQTLLDRLALLGIQIR